VRAHLRQHAGAERAERAGRGAIAVPGLEDLVDRRALPRRARLGVERVKGRQAEDFAGVELVRIAARGGFEGVEGTPDGFEYWSLARSDKSDTGFGYRCEPILEGQKRTGIPRAEFLSQTEMFLHDALNRWILGDEPFAPPVSPPFPGYADYDQLMRFDEWRFRNADE
jgi:hypothetical protein